MTKTLDQLEQIATDCMESSNPNVAERHRGAAACARGTAAEHPASRSYYRAQEAAALIEALQLHVADEELATAELLLVAAMIAARANGGALELEEARPLQLLVALEGGVISGIVADRPLDVVCLDYDTEGADEEDLFNIPQSDGSTAEAFRRTESAVVDAAFIEGARAARPTNPEKRLEELQRIAGMSKGSAWEESCRREAEALAAELEAEREAVQA